MPQILIPPVSEKSVMLALPPEAEGLRLPRIVRLRREPPDPARAAALIPLFYAALLFVAGIVVARFVDLRPAWLLVSLMPLACVAVWSIVTAPRVMWLPLAVIWLVLGCWSAEMEPQPRASQAVVALSNGLLRMVEGTVMRAGPVHHRETEATSDQDSDGDKEDGRAQVQQVDIAIASAEVVTDTGDTMAPVARDSIAGLRLSIRWPAGAARAILCGERVRVLVQMQRPDTYRDPGVWDRVAYLEGQGITATASVVDDESRLVRVGREASFACRFHDWQQAASTRIGQLPERMRGWPTWLRMDSEDAAMLAALATGDRTYLTRRLRVGFERTGSFHLIVVSGLHLAILAGCVFALARRLKVTRMVATLTTIGVALGYALFTGFAAPVQRSFWMVALYLLGRLVYRGRSPLNVIGFAALCLVAVSPRSVFDASFQMTILSVTAIAGVAVPVLERTVKPYLMATRDLGLISLDVKLPPRMAQFRVMLRLIASHAEPALGWFAARRALPLGLRMGLRLMELVTVAAVVELALALPMAIYFHRITVYALPVNLLILPLLAVLVPATMVLLLTLTVSVPAAALPASVCVVVLHGSVGLVRWLGGWTWADIRVSEPGIWQVAIALMLFVLALQMARGGRWLQRISLAALVCMALVALWPRPVAHPPDGLLFEAIDVGQGDSLLLIAPDGKTLLVDGGGLVTGFSPQAKSDMSVGFDVGEEVVSAALWSRGIRRLDAVALTHAHQDHMGGLAAVLKNFRPKELWVGNNPPGVAYNELLREAAEEGVAVRRLRAGDTVPLGQIAVRVLAPAVGYRPGRESANDDSLVLQARVGETSVLLAGDAQAAEERTMLVGAKAEDLRSSVLKVGHHGSLTSTRPEFLAMVQPEWAVISCGRRNRFGHPRLEILEELEAAHVRTLRTDLDGASCLVLDGRRVTLQLSCTP